MRCPPVSANPACRRCSPHYAMRFTLQPARACASSRCRSRSWRNYAKTQLPIRNLQTRNYLGVGSWELGVDSHVGTQAEDLMKRAFVVVAFLFAIIDIGAAAPPALNTE